MQVPIETVTVTACEVPTDQPESDGTLEWDRTVVVLVEVQAQGATGFGYTYADGATATLVRDTLGPLLLGQDAFAIRALWERQRAAVRNLGRSGVAAMAISAVDVALWDLKARALGLPLADLLGRVRDSIDIYGSGGFCSYRGERLERQLAGARERPGVERQHHRHEREARGGDERHHAADAPRGRARVTPHRAQLAGGRAEVRGGAVGHERGGVPHLPVRLGAREQGAVGRGQQVEVGVVAAHQHAAAAVRQLHHPHPLD